MDLFDPARHISGSAAILRPDGTWPSFHDAEVYSLRFWRGDIRPDDNVWVAPVIDASLELAALEQPFVVDLRFHDCDFIDMSGFNHDNMIYDLTFCFEERGYLVDGTTPLTPYICVTFERSFGVALTFKCFRAEVVGRRPVKGPPYA